MYQNLWKASIAVMVGYALILFLSGCAATGQKLEQWGQPNPQKLGAAVNYYCEQDPRKIAPWAQTVRDFASPHIIEVTCK